MSLLLVCAVITGCATMPAVPSSSNQDGISSSADENSQDSHPQAESAEAEFGTEESDGMEDESLAEDADDMEKESSSGDVSDSVTADAETDADEDADVDTDAEADESTNADTDADQSTDANTNADSDAQDEGKESAAEDTDTSEGSDTETGTGTSEDTDTEEEADKPAPYELPEDMYFSELTGEPISIALQDQRPVSFMIDNDARALPHFGTADADVIYELINSTANNRVTRFMAVIKDWGSIQKMGNIRSTRPTNIMLNGEWNAVLCHDGGPYHINAYLNKGYTDHFSGTFSRVANGKATEFTEYCLAGDLDRNFRNTGVSKNYNQYRPERESHFQFADYGTTISLPEETSYPGTNILLPLPHNKPELHYNEETGLYDYYEFGELYHDANDGRTLSFKNVIIQKCTYNQLDNNGYLVYNCIGDNQEGFLVTEGRFMPIKWAKMSDLDITKYYDFDDNELTLNTGKTYITLIPPDVWLDVTIY